MTDHPLTLGRRFGRLVVIADKGRDKNHHHVVRCACDCGNEKTVRLFLLIGGRTASCGCSRIKAKPVTPFEAPMLTIATLPLREWTPIATKERVGYWDRWRFFLVEDNAQAAVNAAREAGILTTMQKHEPAGQVVLMAWRRK